VFDSGSFVSDGEISQIQFVTFGEVVTERMCSSGLASEFQRGVEWEERQNNINQCDKQQTISQSAGPSSLSILPFPH